MVIDPFSAGLGIFQAGLSIFGGAKQAKQQAYQSAYDRTFRNKMIGYENEDIKRNYSIQLQQAGEQVGLNREAANRAYISEQRRLNDVFSSAAFESQGLIASLAQVQGTNAAAERYGRSAQRIRDIEGLGNYGRQQAILADNLSRAADASRYSMEEIYRQNEMADRNTWLGVSVPPSTQAGLPPARGPSSGNTALMIGNALLSGFNTYNAYKPPGGGSGAGNSFGTGSSGLPSWGSSFNYQPSFTTSTKLSGWSL